MASTGGMPTSGAGHAGTTPSTAGTGVMAFGGTANTGGTGSAGAASGGKAGSTGAGGMNTAGAGTGGTATAGAGGKATGGAGGSGSGGMSGSSSGGKGGTGSGGAGTAGSGPVGTGSCAGTAAWAAGAGDKYAKDAKVTAVCNDGTPCTLAQPPLTKGKTYEFKCLDQYNCGGQDPGSTNWGQPPWEATKLCE